MYTYPLNTMEEILEMLKNIDSRMKHIENELAELKLVQKPLTNKDFVRDLNKCPGTEFGFWVSKIEVTTDHLKTLFSEKKNIIYLDMLRDHFNKHENNCIRVFANKNNSIFIYTNGNWKLMSGQELEEFVKTLYNKVASLNNKCKDDDLGMKENMLYLDRMKKIMELKKVSPIKFKNALYKLLREYND